MFDAKQEDRSALAVVPFGFWTDHVPQADGSLIAVDFAKWGKKGYANWESSDRVTRLQKSAEDAKARPEPMLTVWDALEPHYKRWKAGQDAVTDGYALEGWVGISKGQVSACKTLHILSVEDLAAASDDVMQKLGIGFVKIREQARSFVKTLNDGTAKIAAENAQLKEDLAQLRKEMEEDRQSMRAFLAKQGIQEQGMPDDVAGDGASARGKPKKAA